MTSDCYAILGVTPTAEDVVIGAAYRALIRHYHPDTNPDPDARARAQEITAAYAVLRDPAKRAEYDAGRAAGHDFWPVEEPPKRPPPMRGVGIAAGLLAFALVGAVWMWPPSDQPRSTSTVAQPVKQPPASSAPAPRELELQPESERLAALHRENDPPPPSGVEESRLDDLVSVDPAPELLPASRTQPARKPALASKPAVAELKRVPAAPAPQETLSAKPKAVAARSGAGTERLVALDRMAAGFFTQSMAHATPTKRELLLSARDRSAALRSACRSDSCVSKAYLQQIRETSAIMEGRAEPPK